MIYTRIFFFSFFLSSSLPFAPCNLSLFPRCCTAALQYKIICGFFQSAYLFSACTEYPLLRYIYFLSLELSSCVRACVCVCVQLPIRVNFWITIEISEKKRQILNTISAMIFNLSIYKWSNSRTHTQKIIIFDF